MNVKQLIEELGQYDEKTEIKTWDGYHDCQTDNVCVSEFKNDGEVYLLICDNQF